MFKIFQSKAVRQIVQVLEEAPKEWRVTHDKYGIVHEPSGTIITQYYNLKIDGLFISVKYTDQFILKKAVTNWIGKNCIEKSKKSTQTETNN